MAPEGDEVEVIGWNCCCALCMQGEAKVDLTLDEQETQPLESQGSKGPRPEPRGVEAPAEAEEGSQEETEEEEPEGNEEEEEEKEAPEDELRVASASLGGQRQETKPREPKGGKRGQDQQGGGRGRKRNKLAVLRRPSGKQPSRPAPPPPPVLHRPSSERKCRVVHRKGVNAYVLCNDKYAGGLSAKRHPEYLSKVR